MSAMLGIVLSENLLLLVFFWARHARAQGWPDVATFHREQD